MVPKLTVYQKEKQSTQTIYTKSLSRGNLPKQTILGVLAAIFSNNIGRLYKLVGSKKGKNVFCLLLIIFNGRR